ncbi:RNA-directed DNA polymerase from mobile element jockey [Araneus ventricosus]|uniref:RNA-directed DNA polymerase from mobile element jockey n=1 Tax=Araneus ventricosus TaxID=182803 RepID=A0A4Y2QPJ8_ARAVE|nr:RNA-directed DNA polymerase from mobile element jockey [Araneus ventricosus]
MQFVQWNVRGITSKILWLLEPPFSFVQCLVLQETWLSASDSFSLKKKKIFCIERQISPRRGLITAVCQDIPAQLISLPLSEVEVFRFVKALLNKDGSPSISNLVLSSGITLRAPIAQADAIAASLIKRAPDAQIPLDFSVDYFETSDDKTLNCPFSFREFQNGLVKTRNKSSGIDQVTKKMSCLSDEKIYKILDLLNNLWTNMLVPESWRIAKIIPILKPGENAAEVTSYRPIALTSVLGKIFEWIILARLLRFYLENKIFSPFHAGFLPYKGCDSLSAALLNKVLTTRALKRFVYGISLDINAAYDNIWHDGLMLKLLQFGVRGKSALWISYFLQDRKAFVSWRGVSFSLFKHERGIPQRSILSPLLFTIFMNYIYSVLPNDVTCFIYADDIFILVEESNIEAIKNKLSFCVSKLESWCNEWHMNIAPQKSNKINLSSRRSPVGFPVLFSWL